jgi:hypothetical protein
MTSAHGATALADPHASDPTPLARPADIHAPLIEAAADANEQDLRSPDTRDAANQQRLRPYGLKRSGKAGYVNPYSGHAAGAKTDATGSDKDLRTPDWRDAAARIRGRQDLRSPDTRDIADGREYPPTPTVVTLKPLPAPGPAATGGFDWSDAAIGAAGAFGLIMLAAGGGVLVVRRREHRNQPVVAS